MTKIACVQTDPKMLEVSANLEVMELKARDAASNGARLVIFPECATTGYCFDSKEEAWGVAENIPGAATDRLATICKELNIYIVAGLAEKAGRDLFNSAVLIGPEGLIGKYRKAHLPMVGMDRFVTRGDTPFNVYDTELGRIGMLVCYDVGFPEPSRILRLMGADLIVVVTNWPYTSAGMPRFIVPSRAIENHVNLAACNRHGTERGIRFIGTSLVIDYMGKEMAKAGEDEDRTIYSDVDMKGARDSFVNVIPGKFTSDRVKDRRPELYGEIVKER